MAESNRGRDHVWPQSRPCRGRGRENPTDQGSRKLKGKLVACTVAKQLAECLNILNRQLYRKCMLAPALTIAVYAAAHSLTVMVDFDELTMAFFAGTDLIIVQPHDTHSPC